MSILKSKYIDQVVLSESYWERFGPVFGNCKLRGDRAGGMIDIVTLPALSLDFNVDD